MLTSSQKRHLRTLAHPLEPVVRVGGGGVSEGVVRATHEALAARELIKVRLDGDRDARKVLGQQLVESTRAELVLSIGRVLVLYRPAEKPADRRITLPAG